MWAVERFLPVTCFFWVLGFDLCSWVSSWETEGTAINSILRYGNDPTGASLTTTQICRLIKKIVVC